MATDILLDDHDGTWVTIKANVVNAIAADIVLDHPGRRSTAGGRRRALVHNTSDGLTINFNDDYPGGVRINQVALNLMARVVDGSDVKLPRTASVGDLIFVRNALPAVVLNGVLVSEARISSSLWLCVEHSPTGVAQWQNVRLDEMVSGTD